MGSFEDAVAAQAAMDPVTKALMAPVLEGVRTALEEHTPARLTRTAEETRRILGVGEGTVRQLIAEGRLVQIAGDRSPVTLASIFQVAGWPLREAPLAAPLTVVPDSDERAS